MNYRNHPIVEGLRVNEDGTSIIYKGEALVSKTYERKNNSVPMEIVAVGYKTVTVMRLVCECWHGMSKNLDYVVKKVNQTAGNHYSNLCWSVQGTGFSHNSPGINTKPKFTEAQFKKLLAEKSPTETLQAFLKRKNVSNKAYYTAKNRYE